jgi:predicted deacylase
MMLSEIINWKRIPVTGSDEDEIVVGYVGEGSPIGVVVAGVHGDEALWGSWAIQLFLDSVENAELVGSLRILPVANTYAMRADARNSPLDEKDLNRSFPGSIDGSSTERVAYSITENVLDEADVVVDLHGGGSWCVNAFAFQSKGFEELARAFEPPFLVDYAPRGGTLSEHCASNGARVVGVEMGGRCFDEEQWAHHVARGLRRVLGDAGVLEIDPVQLSHQPIKVSSLKVINSDKQGLFMPSIRESGVGKVIPAGTLLGRLHDPSTFEVLEEYLAPFSVTGLLLLRPTLTWVECGTMMYVLGEVKDD